LHEVLEKAQSQFARQSLLPHGRSIGEKSLRTTLRSLFQGIGANDWQEQYKWQALNRERVGAEAENLRGANGSGQYHQSRFDCLPTIIFEIHIWFSYEGISRLRAVVLYELQSALAQYARRKYLNGEITQAHLKNIYQVRKWQHFLQSTKCQIDYQEVRNNLLECIEIFGYEPACLPEGQLAAVARLDLIELDEFAETLNNKAEK